MHYPPSKPHKTIPKTTPKTTPKPTFLSRFVFLRHKKLHPNPTPKTTPKRKNTPLKGVGVEA